MKTIYLLVIIHLLVLGASVRAQDPDWTVDWPDHSSQPSDDSPQSSDGSSNQGFDNVFAKPGVIFDDLTIKGIISVLGSAWQADDVLQSVGYVCAELGPKVDWLTGGLVREFCEPVLEELQSGSYDGGYELCMKAIDIIEELQYGSDYFYYLYNNTHDTEYETYNRSYYNYTYYNNDSYISYNESSYIYNDTWEDDGFPIDVPDLWTFEICREDGSVSFDDFDNFSPEYYVYNTVYKLYGVTQKTNDAACKAVAEVIESRRSLQELVSEFATEWISIFLPIGGKICSCWDDVAAHIFSNSSDDFFGVSEFNEVVLIGARALGFNDREDLCSDLESLVPDNASDFASHLVDEMFAYLEDPQRCACTAHDVIDFVLPLIGITKEEVMWYMQYFTGFESIEEVCSYMAGAFSDVEVSADSIECDDGQTPEWYVEWTTEPKYDPERIQVFHLPGFILPDLTVQQLISVSGEIWQADGLIEALGYLCVDVGSRLNWLAGGFVEEICEPYLEALRSSSPYDVSSVCLESMSSIETFFNISLGDLGAQLDNLVVSDGPPYEVQDLSSIKICLDDGSISFEDFEKLNISFYMSHVFNVVYDLYGISSFDEDSICQAVSDITASGKDIPTLVSEPIIELITLFLPVGAEICSCWDAVFDGLFAESEDEGFGIDQFNEILMIAMNSIGFDDRQDFCDELAAVGPDELQDFAKRLVDSVLKFLEDPETCICTSQRAINFLLPIVGIEEEELNTYVYYGTGLQSVGEVCNYVGHSFGGVTVDLDTLECPAYTPYNDPEESPCNNTEWCVDWSNKPSYDLDEIEIFSKPGEILPDLTIQDIIASAGEMWRATDIVRAVGYFCVDIGANINWVTGGVVQQFCDPFLEALESGSYDEAYSLCESAWSLFSGLSGDDYEGQAEEQTEDSGPPYDVLDLSTITICSSNGNVSFAEFEHLDILPFVWNTAYKLYNISAFDEPHVCTAVTNIINDRRRIPDLISELLVEWLTIWLPVGAEICSCWDDVFDSAFDGADENEHFGIAQIQELLTIGIDVIGYDSQAAFCNQLMSLQPADLPGEAQSIVDSMFVVVENPATCACSARRVLTILLPAISVSVDEFTEALYTYTGFTSIDEACTFIGAAFAETTVGPDGIQCDDIPDCNEIIDCFGMCGGDATEDCDGTCGGTLVKDCAFECGGSAYINDCGECVGGTTGRTDEFGKDVCGFCPGESTIEIDCNGDCGGTAVRDACQVCVGGNTGLALNASDDRLDCFGVCDGVFQINECDECVQPYEDGTLFTTRDCHGDCKGFAMENECGYCTGGNSGNPADTGITGCGVCNTTMDSYFCLGCDDLPYSGLVDDACGVCDGTGDSCVAVDSLEPNVIPHSSNYQSSEDFYMMMTFGIVPPDVYQTYIERGGKEEDLHKCLQVNSKTNYAYKNASETFTTRPGTAVFKMLRLRGAGLQDTQTKQCKFRAEDGSVVSTVDFENEDGNYFECTANLVAGTYTIHLATETFDLSDANVTLYVYPDINVDSVAETEYDIEDSGMINVTMTAASGAFTAYKDIATPVAIVITDAGTLRREGVFGGEDDELLLFTAPMPASSASVLAYPSLNGIDYLVTPGGAGFTLTFYAVAPVAQSFEFSSSGTFLKLKFDHQINEEAVTSCDAIFTDTTQLGSGASCVAFPYHRTVYVIPSGASDETLIVPGDTLTLVDDVIHKRGEEYARNASGTVTATAPDDPVAVHAVLKGTESISNCGDVRLSALQSTGGRGLTYEWSVDSDSGTVRQALTNELAASEAAYLSVSGSHLDAGTAYVFSVTVTNFLGSEDTATLEVTRSSVNTPDVVIYPERVDIEHTLVSKFFYLRADVTFYDACGGAAQTEYTWSVDDTSVALNLQTKNRPILFVPANSLPGNTDVTFTLNVYTVANPDDISTQSVTITTVYSDLVAVIVGGNERTVGVDSGSLSLDGSESYDPDNSNEDFSYLWTCSVWNEASESFEPCVSSQTRNVFPAEDAAKTSTLALEAADMYVDSTYKITLHVTKVSRTASTCVTILAKAGNPPEIFAAQPLPDKIPHTASLTLSVIVSHTSNITVEWSAVGTDEGNGYVDFVTLSPRDFSYGSAPSLTTYAYVFIPSGVLESGMSYAFQVKVTDNQGQEAITKLTTETYGGVTSCTLDLDDGSLGYQELQQLVAVVGGCVTDEDAYPLTYQILLRTRSGRYRALTGALAEGRLSVVGPPSSDQSGVNIFQIRVCNAFLICDSFGLTLDVTAITSFTQEDFDQSFTDLVQPKKLAGKYLLALVSYNILASIDAGSSRKRRVAVQTSTTAEEQLTLLREAIDATVLDTASAQALIDQAGSVAVPDLTLSDIDDLLDILIDLVDVFSGEALPESSSEVLLTKVGEIANELEPGTHAAFFVKISYVTDSLLLSQAGDLALDADPVTTVADTLTTTIYYVVPSEVLTTTRGDVAFSVDLGSEIASMYGASWSCDSATCNGVKVVFVQYDEGVDLFSEDSADAANIASSILVINLLDPESDSMLNVTGLTTPISITMSVTSVEVGKVYDCVYWDTLSRSWSQEGLTSVYVSDNTTTCQTTHLSVFALYAMDAPTTTVAMTTASQPTGGLTTLGSSGGQGGLSTTTIIIIIVVVVVVLLLVVGIGLVVASKKSKSKVNVEHIGGEMPPGP